MASIAGLIGSVGFLPGSSGASSHRPFSGKTPAQVLAIAEAAALAKGSVHWVERGTLGSGSFEYVTDAGSSQGKQTVRSATGNGTILLVSPQMAYVNGDVVFMSFLPDGDAIKYSGKWIALPSSNSAFEGYTLGLAMSSIFPGATPSAPLSFTKPTTFGGKRVVGISGSFDLPEHAQGAFGTQVMYVSTVAPYLPVGYTQRGTLDGGSLIEATRMSRYGESVSVAAPANSIPVSSITAPTS